MRRDGSSLVAEALTRPGGAGPNEDLVGWHGSLAWVVDGATPVTPNLIDPASDARWLAERVDASLRGVAADGSAPSVADIVRLVALDIDEELRRAGFPNEALPPACSLGLVRIESDEVTLAIVGDALVYADGPGQLLDDSRFGRNEKRSRSDHGDRASISSADVRDDIAVRRRRYIYGPGDMYVLSRSPRVALGVRSKTLQRARAGGILMMSDGFARLVDTYRVFSDYSSLYKFVRHEGLEAAYETLRAHERRSGGSSANFKKADDASAVLISEVRPRVYN